MLPVSFDARIAQLSKVFQGIFHIPFSQVAACLHIAN